MKGLSWLNNLKIRASWGQLGNQEIGIYPSYVTINFNPAYIFGGVGVDGGLQTSFANSDISWETSVTTNVGLDFAFLRNRLYGSFDWDVKNTHDILLKLPIPEVTGMTAPYQNAGVVRNTGWDLEIGHKNTIGDFNYAVNFNLSEQNPRNQFNPIMLQQIFCLRTFYIFIKLFKPFRTHKFWIFGFDYIFILNNLGFNKFFMMLKFFTT